MGTKLKIASHIPNEEKRSVYKIQPTTRGKNHPFEKDSTGEQIQKHWVRFAP